MPVRQKTKQTDPFMHEDHLWDAMCEAQTTLRSVRSPKPSPTRRIGWQSCADTELATARFLQQQQPGAWQPQLSARRSRSPRGPKKMTEKAREMRWTTYMLGKSPNIFSYDEEELRHLLLAKQRASKAVQVYDAFPEEELTHTAYIRKCKYAERASQICTSAMTERAFWGKEKLHVRPHSPRVSRRCKESCLGVLVRVESEIFAAFAKLLDRWTPEQLFRAMLRRKKSTLSEEVFVESLRSLEVAPRHISKKMLSRIFYKLTGVGPDQCRIEEMTYDTFLKKMLTVSKNKQPAPAVPHAAPASQPYSSKSSTLGLEDL